MENGKKLYKLNDNMIDFISTHSDKIMDICGLKLGDCWTDYCYPISEKLLQDMMKGVA